MVFDKSGSLAGTRRHDYLAFGEEWFAGMGGRTTGEGYVADGVRQKFTQKERDNETGLDYFLVRHYSSAHGRFTQPDDWGGTALDPQTLNLYSYVTNNPLVFIDPTGHFAELGDKRSFLDQFSLHRLQAPLTPEEFLPMGLCGSGCGSQQPQNPSDSPKNPATVLEPNGEIPGVGDTLIIDSTPAFGSGKATLDKPYYATGYSDFNINYGSKYFIGVSLGVMFNERSIHPYIGPGITAPRGLGWSFTHSPDDITEGVNGELQITIPAFGKRKPGVTFVQGWDPNGETFQGFGTGSPGASASAYFVFSNIKSTLENVISPRPRPPLVPRPIKK